MTGRTKSEIIIAYSDGVARLYELELNKELSERKKGPVFILGNLVMEIPIDDGVQQ